MSGSCISSGIIFNDGKKISKESIEDILDSKIEGLSIQVIPLIQKTGITVARFFGQMFQQFIHPKIFSPTLSHIAIHLTLSNASKIDSNYGTIYNVILEYGQYYSDESEKIKNSDSSLKCRKTSNNFQYYYINKDGARITLVPNEDLFIFFNQYQYEDKIYKSANSFFSFPSLMIMASNHYGISVEECLDNIKNLSSHSDYNFFECDIMNKITLRELINNFRGKNWEAKDYNVLTHNCQDFANEIIKILKAVRIHDYDKIRTREKGILPNCIISTLWDNEKLSEINTLGRIPVFGLFFDVAAIGFIRRK